MSSLRRVSGLQKQVFRLYRAVIRASRLKDDEFAEEKECDARCPWMPFVACLSRPSVYKTSHAHEFGPGPIMRASDV
ncbi:hypothetical protein CYMTET_56361 [Cymbomonas tetramitiformis]|uniref:Uncharacterized protein n=1 Tax=Cymbomonas tetramitiformis TaxID=36881 RepID=A0AAE0ENU8_9CHLO|nr:hypothetical protein CYMTET_56361 [Cymbomonas tetramitiformis]